MDFDEIMEDGGGNSDGEDARDNFLFGLEPKELEELKQNRDSVIFLLDCHPSMHQKNPHNGEDQASNVDMVLKAALSFMKTKIITSENDKVGIVLYGCKAASNSLKMNHIYVL